ncbi:ATP-binding protein [Chryseobacterium arthrosphaerae]|uniref:tetratricopeptide repeat-containing sensor histidine kinase n=1 Tax=Chryseobacterium arthrosphaerae TaxID=651561 RepID=UPI000F4D42E3|nr:ATP-binding protein [Chryseobacterium arthrosphaerae]AYZ14283.1 ATP-binding protein [Chryseobacterium arthrosphaerae]
MYYLRFSLLFLLINCNYSESSKSNTVENIAIKKADSIYKEAENQYYEKNDNQQAFLLFSKAEDIYKQNKDSLNTAASLAFKAMILNDIGDHFTSNERAIEALSFLNLPKDSAYLPSIYNTLAIAQKNLKHYAEALQWYEKALKANNIDGQEKIIKNNIADLYAKKRDYIKSIEIYKSLLNDKSIIKSITDYAMILDNYNYTKWLQNKNFNPEPALSRALQLKIDSKDIKGQISTHSHLAEYYSETNIQKAIQHTDAKYRLSFILNNPYDRLESLGALLRISSSTNSKKIFKEFQNLNDSIITAKDDAKNRFALIEYDVEKKNIENQRLKYQKAKGEALILKQSFIMGTLIVTIFIIIIWYRRRQKNLKQKNELKIKENQLKMSKKVHDVVANGIYQVMTKLENQKDFDRDKALDELEFVYEKSRDISYDKIGEEKEFSKVISELIASFTNETVKTFTAGNSPEIWESVPPTVKEEVYQMVRELMVNMKKHSQASHVAVKFDKINNTVEIQYKDNGIGISGDLIYKNGLRNTASRIEAINGTITFDTKIEKGLKVNLSFPVS